MLTASSRLTNPLENFGDGGALAVHQHADAVDARGEPEQEYYGGEAYGERESELPEGRRLRDDAYEHSDGREERHHRDPEGERRVRGAYDGEGHVEAEDEYEYDRHRELPALLRRRHHRADERVDGRVDEVAEQEEEDEVSEDARRDVRQRYRHSLLRELCHAVEGEGREGEAPDGELRQRHERDADELAHHQRKRANRGEQNLRNARLLLLYDRAEDDLAVHENGQVDDEADAEDEVEALPRVLRRLAP